MKTFLSRRAVRLLSSAVALILLAGLTSMSTSCRPEPVHQADERATTAPDDGEEALELRTYEVPEASLPQLRSLLRTLLQSGDTQVGRVDAGPGNRLVVLAPSSIQAGIASLLEEVANNPVAAQPPTTYVVDHWLVLGRPAEETAFVGPLDEVMPALDSIAGNRGPTSFALLEHLGLRSMDHEEAEIDGQYGGVRQVIASEHGYVLADLNVRSPGSEWRTRLRVASDQLVVLSQVGFQATLRSNPFGSGPTVTEATSENDVPTFRIGEQHESWEPAQGTNLYHIFRIQPVTP